MPSLTIAACLLAVCAAVIEIPAYRVIQYSKSVMPDPDEEGTPSPSIASFGPQAAAFSLLASAVRPVTKLDRNSMLNQYVALLRWSDWSPAVLADVVHRRHAGAVVVAFPAADRLSEVTSFRTLMCTTFICRLLPDVTS